MSNLNIGIIYISFGEVSAQAAKESLESARHYSGNIPAISIGTHPVEGTTFIPWKGQSPWEEGAPVKYSFYAARIKPFLIQYSPFEYNLYLDADTEICGDILPGFKILFDHDLCIAYSRKWHVEDLYRDDGAAGPQWDVPKKERDYTHKLLGGDQNKLINTGVIFFHKGLAATQFFNGWYGEWERFSHWDEQLAFIRTEHLMPETKILHLPSVWNYHHRRQPDMPIVIWHKWWTARDKGIVDPNEVPEEPDGNLDKSKNMQDIFSAIYNSDFWLSKETKSGRGSELIHTTDIRAWLPKFIQSHHIRSMIDAGCGDFNWMRKIGLSVPYIGYDIVPELVRKNQQAYGSTKPPFIFFKVADITKDQLDRADLVLCRDVLFHLCFENIYLALKNLLSVTNQYILITNNPKTRVNTDIEDGGFRRLNFLLSPFNLPVPRENLPDCKAAAEEILVYRPDELSHVSSLLH
jgi:hypothetical protein